MLSTYTVPPKAIVFGPMGLKSARNTIYYNHSCTRQPRTRWVEHDGVLPSSVHVTGAAWCKFSRGYVPKSVSRQHEELSSTIEKATELEQFNENFRWGTAEEQGPRESMEDAIHVVENGRCGFFFASTAFNINFMSPGLVLSSDFSAGTSNSNDCFSCIRLSCRRF